MITDESVVPDGSSQEIKIGLDPSGATTVTQQGSWEAGLQSCFRHRPSNRKLTFGEVQVEAYCFGGSLQMLQSRSHVGEVPGQDAVIQVEQSEVEAGLPKGAGNLVQGYRKKQWAQRVALLYSTTRLQGAGPKLQPARLSVAPGGPSSQLREVSPDLLKHHGP